MYAYGSLDLRLLILILLKSITRQLGSIDKDVLGFPEQRYRNYKMRIWTISH